MKTVQRSMKLMLVVAFVSVLAAGCKDKSMKPGEEHPTEEHQAKEHSEHPAE